MDKHKQVYDYPDDFGDYKEGQILGVGNQGYPNQLINPEAMFNDTRAFWSMHEKKLVLVIVICSMYFLAVLI